MASDEQKRPEEREPERPRDVGDRDDRPGKRPAALLDALAQEFPPLFADAISPLDWQWEPEITAEIDTQVQALVRGDTDARSSAKSVQAVADELRTSGRSYFP